MITSIPNLRFTFLLFLLLFFVPLLSLDFALAADAGERPRARDIGIAVGISGETAVIAPAPKAKAGRMLPGRPTAVAARYMVPITAARTTDGGSPVTKA